MLDVGHRDIHIAIALCSQMSLMPLSRYPIAHVVAATNASSEDRKTKNQIYNFHGRCSQIGRPRGFAT
jgi:hypothetical protein